MIKKTTVKQKQLLEFVDYFIKKNGFSPTYREISNHFNCDVSTIFQRVLLLEQKGYLTTCNGKARTIKIIKGSD